MIKKLLIISLLFYYSFGVFILPEGDFSTLPELPVMYSHCKATEDPDMDIIDFFSEHLLHFEGIFEPNESGEKELPHQPFQFHHQISQIFLLPNFFSVIYNLIVKSDARILYSDFFVPNNFSIGVFHPPQFC